MTLGLAEIDVVLEGLADTRERTLDLTAPLSDAEVEDQHSPLMSPLAWDLGHIAAYEDLWLVHRYGDRPLLREDLAAVYDAFETPRSARGDLALLDRRARSSTSMRCASARSRSSTERGIGDGRSTSW